MKYIVFDLEWNQSPSGKEGAVESLPFEIIEIGAVKLDENFARAWYNLSIARFKMGKIDEAIEAIDKAIETDPANAQQYTNLKNYLINNGKKR